MAEFINLSTNFTSILAVILTVLSFAIGLVQYFQLRTDTVVKKQPVDALQEDDLLTKRFKEAETIYKRLEKQALSSKRSNSLLIIAQYVVGTTLASSFIQQSLPPFAIGILGVLVLASTIFHQQFRPDIRAKVDSLKAQFLKSEIRRAENEDHKRKKGEINVLSESKIIALLSQALDKVAKEDEWEKQIKTTLSEKESSSNG